MIAAEVDTSEGFRVSVCDGALRLLALAVVLAGCQSEAPPSTDVPGAAGTAGEPALEAGLPTPHEDFVGVGGVRLQVLDWGGEGDLLLFIPGVGAAAHAWTGVAPHFAADHHVIAVTRREHGGSDKPGTDLSLDLLADDLAGVIDAYTDEPAILVGWSFGGLEMTRLAARHPSRVKGLVFVDAVDAVVEALPDVRVVVLDDVSHMFPVEAPETMVELLERFLEEEVR